ncbi:MAG: hypothetical protein PCFJNLEI_00607 [Verrucomicrobiae bacterium]|nr:hypothetical protein [Verrucomicrobiae bacterium]
MSRASELRFPDGTRLRLLVRGGRVLGLYAPGSAENFLWNNPRPPKSGWPNPGGDRTWLAPEADLFVQPGGAYVVTPTVDPGRYRIAGATLVNRARVKNWRTGQTATFTIRKTVAPAANPLRYERQLTKRVSYAGYTLRTEVTGAAFEVGLWQLLQLPHGGEMLVPTYRRAEPVTYFGQVAGRDLSVTAGTVRYRMRASGVQKIGIRAAVLTGRVGYLTKSQLVVRNFLVNPSGEYVDTPWEDRADRTVAFQACNVNTPVWGAFSELEHHVPATTGRDESQVWAFRGPPDVLSEVAARLLGGNLSA